LTEGAGQSYGYAGGGAAGRVRGYSKTNIQVEGVDEADIVKTDGEYLYVASSGSVRIVRAYPAGEAQVLSQVELNGSPMGIFINGDKLVVLEGTPGTSIKVYDVSDRESPVLARNISLDGGYFSSRMIGDYVYAVINQPAYYNYQEDEVALPKIWSADRAEEIPASQIYYPDVADRYYTFTTVFAVNVQDDAEEPAHKTFLLPTCNIYVSLNNIYIIFPKAERTLIYRVHVEGSNVECVAKGEVPGSVLNQFSMDEHEDHFRVATTTGHVATTRKKATSRNHLYVLDMDLNIVGRLEDLAPGERIYSARFMGSRCYLVTFRKVDPLFVIDLENPYEPAVLGWLKVTGYSDYLHPYGEDHLIGVGKETVAAEVGDFAWYQGVKISLFDVRDVSNPLEIAKYVIGDRGTNSPILTDHKAFLFDESRGLLVIPVLVAEIDKERYPSGAPPYTHGEYVWQGAYIFHVSLEGDLVLRGRVTHLEGATDPTDGSYHVERALYIDSVLYTVSDRKIKMNNLESLDEINEVKLP